MKIVFLTALLLVAPMVLAASTDSWYTGWPESLGSSVAQHQVPAQDITEIPHSLFVTAEQLLAKKPFIYVGNNYFPARIPDCPSNTKAYLVRALYEHGSTGTFQVFTVGTTLLVRHYALGAAAKPHRSAIIVCLGFTPTKVYIATGGAM